LIDLIDHPSPNWNERPEGVAIDTVVLHYTGMQSGKEALGRLCCEQAQVSSHYLIDEDGTAYQLVDDKKRAWHAGVSSWQGRGNLNHSSIGIELVNPGHEFGYRDFPEAQIASLLALLNALKEKHAIPTSRFIGHSDIAPLRKNDPGERFPWKKLSHRGFGVFSEKDFSNQEFIELTSNNAAEIKVLNKQLGIIGYDGFDSDGFGAQTSQVIRAFQAHWRPEGVHGKLDKGTWSALQEIAKLIIGDTE
jgi:N-acetylmuramoyl-L-alanine amidase